MTGHDVIIVGAGLAGLTAAVARHDDGARVLVLEAADRVGGRIHAVTNAAGGAVADLGPTWVWPPYQPVVARWMVRLGLAPFPQFNAGDGVLDGWAPELQRYPLPAQDGIARLEGGPVAFINALARRLPADALRTGARVTAITEADATRLRVSLRTGETHSAPHVIVAAPLRVVAANITMPGIDEAVRRDMQRVPTWMSTQAKAVALYDRPFWRDAGLSGRIASRLGPLFEAHDHSPADASIGAIFGFVQWTPAERRANPDGLRRAIREQLARCLGPAAGAPTALHIEDWAANPFVCSDADLDEPPRHPELAPATLRGTHLQGRLRFAVSETSEISPGLIEGALAAGERAAAA